MSEQVAQAKIKKHLESLGAYVVKVVSATKSGVPDLLVCYEGRFIAIEVKQYATRYNTSPLQEYNMEQIKLAGGNSFVAWDIESLMKGLKNG